MACIGITGAMSSTPIDALNALLDIPSLSFRIIGQARMIAYRLEQTGQWALKTSVLQYGNQMMMSSDYMVDDCTRSLE